MSGKIWYEMPVRQDEESGIPRAKYTLSGDVTLIYSGNRAFAAFPNEQEASAIEGYNDVRRMTDAEVATLRQKLPFAFLPTGEETEEESNYIGLGDVISWITHRLGIHECESCKRRKKWLNRIPVWPRRKKGVG